MLRRLRFRGDGVSSVSGDGVGAVVSEVGGVPTISPRYEEGLSRTREAGVGAAEVEGGGTSVICRLQEGPSRISGGVSHPNMGLKMEDARGWFSVRAGGACDCASGVGCAPSVLGARASIGDELNE